MVACIIGGDLTLALSAFLIPYLKTKVDGVTSSRKIQGWVKSGGLEAAEVIYVGFEKKAPMSLDFLQR